jgi:hypothetical protein
MQTLLLPLQDLPSAVTASFVDLSLRERAAPTFLLIVWANPLAVLAILMSLWTSQLLPTMRRSAVARRRSQLMTSHNHLVS